jgi:DNA-binding NarL/FixJ family response regulator
MGRPRLLLVAESSAILRAGLRAVVERHGGYELLEVLDAGAAADAGACHPDICLVGLDLPGDPLAAVSRLAAAGANVLVWDDEPPPSSVLAAVAAGAIGFLPKTVSGPEILAAIEQVAVGDAVLPSDIASRLVTAIQRSTGLDRLHGALSARERRVLELVADGLRNREIGTLLGISEFTVKRHVQNILRKLELPSRKAAAALYVRSPGARSIA